MCCAEEGVENEELLCSYYLLDSPNKAMVSCQTKKRKAAKNVWAVCLFLTCFQCFRNISNKANSLNSVCLIKRCVSAVFGVVICFKIFFLSYLNGFF